MKSAHRQSQRRRILVRAFVAQNGTQGSEYDLHVERERPVLYVVEVQTNHLLEGELRTAADLPVACHPRDGPEPSLVGLLHPQEVTHRQRSRTDQAHLSLE